MAKDGTNRGGRRVGAGDKSLPLLSVGNMYMKEAVAGDGASPLPVAARAEPICLEESREKRLPMASQFCAG